MAYSEKYEAALVLASREHREQNRKGTEIPYITHPVHVSVILARHGFPESLVVAGLLHDVVEDQDYPLDRIEEEFGPDVAEMVDALSEQKRDTQGKVRPWEVRKRESLKKLRQASDGAVTIKAADVLHNSRTLAADLRRAGPRVWDRFNRGPDQTLWYYTEVAGLVRERLGDHPLVAELEDALNDLALVVERSGSGR
jgi:(p)ppGpp synthase/HD superfamily hydrolase